MMTFYGGHNQHCNTYLHHISAFKDRCMCCYHTEPAKTTNHFKIDTTTILTQPKPGTKYTLFWQEYRLEPYCSTPTACFDRNTGLSLTAPLPHTLEATPTACFDWNTGLSLTALLPHTLEATPTACLWHEYRLEPYCSTPTYHTLCMFLRTFQPRKSALFHWSLPWKVCFWLIRGFGLFALKAYFQW